VLRWEPEEIGIALYRDIEMAFWLPQTEAALVRMEGQ
jgi:hypothetical protein